MEPQADARHQGMRLARRAWDEGPSGTGRSTAAARPRRRRDDRVRGGGLSRADFRGTRYFAELDGLRALSILLVVSVHTTDPLWAPLHGNVGVTVFFVISGFIITTLLLREEEDRGHARIGAFYARRAFRILPVYYVVLAAYVLLVGVLHLQPGADELWRGLPYFLTYQNDLSSNTSGFAITWSLAVEEKFYLLWPLLFLPAVSRTRRAVVLWCVAVLIVPFAFAPGESRPSVPSWHYPAVYAPIVFGCLVALALHSRRGWAVSRRVANGPVAAVLVLAAAAVMVLVEDGESNVHVAFAALVALLVPACLTGPAWFRAVLRSRFMVYVGTRSYAVYLVHRLAKGAVDRVVAPGGDVLDQLARLVLVTAIALLGAEVLRALVEQPMIRLGRRLTSRTRAGREVPDLAPAVDRPDHPVAALAGTGAAVEPRQRRST